MQRLISLVLFCAALAAGAAKETALDRYVKAPDPNYRFDLVKTQPGDGFTVFVLNMTSQQYLTAKEVNQPLWKHWVTIVRPDAVKSSTAMLFISGGSTSDKPPEKTDPALIDIAKASNAVVSEVRNVPNEPLYFTDDGEKRSEDSIIVYTWLKFLKTGDEKWPLRLPMTKAAVRAMDTVTAFLASGAGGQVTVDKFVVGGGSKRGWTTWTTAAVDRRVVAIIPAVIDTLNCEPSFIHHFRVYGFFAPAVEDYTKSGYMNWNGTAENRKLLAIEDPYSYRDRLTMPKFLLNSAGDQFFVPDAWQFYWKDLKGEKYLRYVPNSDHGLRRTDAWQSVGAYFTAFVKGQDRPRFEWAVKADGTLEVRAKDKPTAVKLWQATNPKARDFRLESLGPQYKSSGLAEAAPGVYRAKPDKPAAGFTAYFIELTFPSGAAVPLKFTTGVKVTPDVYPFPAPKLPPPDRH